MDHAGNTYATRARMLSRMWLPSAVGKEHTTRSPSRRTSVLSASMTSCECEMMPHRYHSTEPNGGRSAVEVDDGKRMSIQALKLHDKHCVMPSTGPNCKLDIAYPMVRGKVRRVGQPRTHWVGTRMGDIVGSLSCDVTVETLAVIVCETDTCRAAATATTAACLPRLVYSCDDAYSARRLLRMASNAAKRLVVTEGKCGRREGVSGVLCCRNGSACTSERSKSVSKTVLSAKGGPWDASVEANGGVADTVEARVNDAPPLPIGGGDLSDGAVGAGIASGVADEGVSDLNGATCNEVRVLAAVTGDGVR